MRRVNFFGFRSAGIFDIIPLPFAFRGDSGRRRLCRRSTFGRTRRFSRIHGFIHKRWSFLIVISDNGPFFDFSTFRERRKRDKVWMILCKTKQGAISEIKLQKR
jgi:hypothetical protein